MLRALLTRIRVSGITETLARTLKRCNSTISAVECSSIVSVNYWDSRRKELEVLLTTLLESFHKEIRRKMHIG